MGKETLRNELLKDLSDAFPHLKGIVSNEVLQKK